MKCTLTSGMKYVVKEDTNFIHQDLLKQLKNDNGSFNNFCTENFINKTHPNNKQGILFQYTVKKVS